MISLSQYNPNDASDILARAALFAGPHPGMLGDQSREAEIVAVLTEIRNRLGLAMHDESPEAARKIDEELSNELESVGFADTDFEKVYDGLGARGELPISSYNITLLGAFPSSFRENLLTLRKAVVSADKIQHLSVPLDTKTHPEQSRLSLFVKSIGTGKKRHWLLIQGNRSGRNLELTNAVRVTDHVENLARAQEPFDLLKAFMLHYGFEIELNGIHRGKFLEDIDLGPWNNIKYTVRATDSDGRPEYMSQSFYKTNDNRARLSNAYSIDVKKYMADRTRMGI
jgi:hypothetical protein